MEYTTTEHYLQLCLYPKRPYLKYDIALNDLNKIYQGPFVGTAKDGISFNNLSEWAIHIMKKMLPKSDLLEAVEIIKNQLPHSKIDWSSTLKAIDIYYTYIELMKEVDNDVFTELISTSTRRAKKRAAVIEHLKKLYNL
jgi:hypothetical protein